MVEKNKIDGIERIIKFMMNSDFKQGNIIVVEDKPEIRHAIRKGLGEDYYVYAAPSFEEAVKIINFYKSMHYAIIDDEFPEKTGGKPANLADTLYDKLVEKFPKVKVFAYAEDPKNLQKPYAGIIPKETSPGKVSEIVLEYASKAEDKK